MAYNITYKAHFIEVGVLLQDEKIVAGLADFSTPTFESHLHQQVYSPVIGRIILAISDDHLGCLRTTTKGFSPRRLLLLLLLTLNMPPQFGGEKLLY